MNHTLRLPITIKKVKNSKIEYEVYENMLFVFEDECTCMLIRENFCFNIPIPRIFWFIYPPIGNYIEAFCIYSWLKYNNYPKSIIKREFKNHLIKYGVNNFTSELFCNIIKLSK